MILPIYAFGHPVLKKNGKDISPEFGELVELIENMYETMYNAKGVGLAAQQVGMPINLFILDTSQIDKEDDEEPFTGMKRAFVNAEIINVSDEISTIEEGCLSIPDIRGDVDRPKKITLRYLNDKFEVQEEDFHGYNARVIQHELDHNRGKLFVEKLGPIKKQLIRRKLEAIKMGKIETDYKMRFGFK
ncbi:MAG TPA: peptide deformylase [Saprospiraceae bacterium]|nr:peptide deformylase [Saprospiraceae bacterium]